MLFEAFARVCHMRLGVSPACVPRLSPRCRLSPACFSRAWWDFCPIWYIALSAFDPYLFWVVASAVGGENDRDEIPTIAFKKHPKASQSLLCVFRCLLLRCYSCLVYQCFVILFRISAIIGFGFVLFSYCFCFIDCSVFRQFVHRCFINCFGY